MNRTDADLALLVWNLELGNEKHALTQSIYNNKCYKGKMQSTMQVCNRVSWPPMWLREAPWALTAKLRPEGRVAISQVIWGKVWGIGVGCSQHILEASLMKRLSALEEQSNDVCAGE